MSHVSENVACLAYQQTLNEFLNNSKSFNPSQDVLAFKNVFNFILLNLEKIHHQVGDILLPIIHHSLRMELQKSNIENNIGDKICALLKVADNNDDLINCSIQILFQILKTLAPEDTQKMSIGNEVIMKLYEILKSHNQSTTTNANILFCIRLYVRKFQGIEILKQFWSSMETTILTFDKCSVNLQILVNMYDEFYDYIPNFRNSTQIVHLIQYLLTSDDHDQRKCAYFLLKKYYLTSETEENYIFWAACINIFENLEENQSHLILPSLEKLKNIDIIRIKETNWLNILYRHILRHNNVLVKRWIIEYLFDKVTYEMLTLETRREYFEALNDTTLYNVESYFLSQLHIKKFFSACDRLYFFDVFCHIKWKAVPLHYWLTQLILLWQKIETSDIHPNCLLKLAVKIRTIQNVTLRYENIIVFNQLFEPIIDNMDLMKYAQYVETLYNILDAFHDHIRFIRIMDHWDMNKFDGNRILSQRFYDIITNQFDNLGYVICEDYTKIILTKLDKQSITSHGFLRYLIVFDLIDSDEKKYFCKQNYNLDIIALGKETDFSLLYHTFYDKLRCGDEEKHFLKRKTTDFYVHSLLNEYNDLKRYPIGMDKLLDTGSQKCLLRLTYLLADHKEKVDDNILGIIIDHLREYLKKSDICYQICLNITKYIQNLMQPEESLHWIQRLLNLDLENMSICNAILDSSKVRICDHQLLITGALIGDAKVGDSRIEEAYECKIFHRLPKCYNIRSKYIQYMLRIGNNESIFNILTEMIKDQQLKKPRYFGNSTEYRLITRITRILWELLPVRYYNLQLFSNLWTLLMDYSSQPNITYMYEYIMIKCIDFEILFKKIHDHLKLKKCTSSQEVSLVFLLYHYCLDNFNCETLIYLERILSLLWPLTMGSNFQTRLFAQLVIVSLLNHVNIHRNLCEINHLSLSNLQVFLNLSTAIKQTIGTEQIEEFSNDVRLKHFEQNLFDSIMNSTNGAYDEYNSIEKNWDNMESMVTKKLTDFAKCRKNKNVTVLINDGHINFDVQRKISPTNDFLPLSNLISYPESKENEIFIVASLIEKLPNLGGIARTCEVLGCKNLVINSKAHMEKSDFKNLSMTAEKTLNVLEIKPSVLPEFLLEKKSKDFKIVGAEQTANSCNFVDFEFPKRCVLLLGHEKEGIPSNLLGFLDYAVEIPQFGIVRSLNVHVTAALFMWEYCKQHIIEQTTTKKLKKILKS